MPKRKVGGSWAFCCGQILPLRVITACTEAHVCIHMNRLLRAPLSTCKFFAWMRNFLIYVLQIKRLRLNLARIDLILASLDFFIFEKLVFLSIIIFQKVNKVLGLLMYFQFVCFINKSQGRFTCCKTSWSFILIFGVPFD